MKHRRLLAVALINGLIVLGCMGPASERDFMYRNLPVATGSADAGEGHTVTFKGNPKNLVGPGIKVGDTLRDVPVVAGDLSNVKITDMKATARIISLVPSLDTKVCEQQTHHLSEKNQGLDRSVQLITVSVDTPFAQKRFADEAKIRNVTFLSDYRSGEFGRAHGLLVKDPHLLARAVMVVDKDNVIRYLQVTPELAELPDMEAAFAAAKKLAGS
jgi:thiol peroxidase